MTEELILSQQVGILSEVSMEIVPEEGKDIWVKYFSGTSQKQESIIKIVWDFEGAGESILWAVKSGEDFKHRIDIPKSEVDGVKKIALVLENNELSSQYMSGYVLLEIK